MHLFLIWKATKFSADHVDERIEVFLEWFVKEKLKNLTVDEFNSTVKTLITERSQADIRLQDEFSRNWEEIINQEYLFSRREEEIKFLQSCDKIDMIEFMTIFLSNKSGNFRKLNIQVVGSNVVSEETLDDKPDESSYDLRYHASDNETFVDNVYDYKQTLESYPVHRIIEWWNNCLFPWY